MNYKQKLDNIAKNVLGRSIAYADYFYNFTNYSVDSIGNLYVQWQNRKSVKELALEEYIQGHDEKVEQFKNIILSSPSFATTVFAMRKNKSSPIVITDGIHRIIGAQRAIIEQPNVKEKIKLAMLLFEGVKINEIQDYILSIPTTT